MLLRSTFVFGLIAAGAAAAGAQQRFITQVLIVPAFRSSDRGLGGKAGDIVRGRVAGAFPKSELRVVSNGDVDDWLRLSGFEENVALSEGEIVDRLYAANDQGFDAAIFNPAAFGTGYPALVAAISQVKFPTTEVHISNPIRRGPASQTAAVSQSVVAGFGIGYALALGGSATCWRRKSSNAQRQALGGPGASYLGVP
jgi:3-dehydroquinate dehydratase